jgi:DNA-binding MarR family transcriptional regulator
MSSDRGGALAAALAQEIRGWQVDQDAFDQVAADVLGLNRTDVRCLDIVEQRQRVTAGDLAAGARLTTGAVTAVLDRLEHAGYVRRVRDPQDRRRVLVELTDAARQRGEAIWGPLGSEAADVLDRYDHADLEIILSFLRENRDLLRRHAERVRMMDPGHRRP